MSLAQQLQKSCVTHPDRHVTLIQRCRDQCKLQEATHLLSYGCSSGEEIDTLLCQFPHATCVIGVDIDAHNVRKAQERFAHDARVRICTAQEFIRSKDDPPLFDMITCFNVLCNFFSSQADNAPVPFALFQSCVLDLLLRLRPGGALCTYGTNYRMSDIAPLPSKIKCTQLPIDCGPVVMYEPDGKRIVPRGLQNVFVLTRDREEETKQDEEQEKPVTLHAIRTSGDKIPMASKQVCFGLLHPGRQSSNLGDYMQTLAQLHVLSVFYNPHTWTCTPGIRHILEAFASTKPSGAYVRQRCAPCNVKIVTLDRDNMSAHLGEDGEVYVIANGWYMHKNANGVFDFPFPRHIRPIFISVHIAHPEMLLDARVCDYFKQYGPVGCRDTSTLKLMQHYSIPAYFSSCLTTTLEFPFESSTSAASREDLEIDTLRCNATHRLTSDMQSAPIDDLLQLAYQHLLNYSHVNSIRSTRIHCLLPTRAVSEEPELVFCSKNGGQDGSWMNRSRFAGLTSCMMDPVQRELLALALFEYLMDKIQYILFGMRTKQCQNERIDLSHHESISYNPRYLRAQHPAILRVDVHQEFASVLLNTSLATTHPLRCFHRNDREFVLRKSPFRAFDERMDIFVTFDMGYIKVFPVFLQHLASSNPTVLLRIWCATRNITELPFAKCPANTILFHFPLDDHVAFSNYTSPLTHVSNVCLDRILIEKCDFGTHRVNRIIYLDLDIAVVGSLLPLLELDSGAKGIIAKTSLVPNVVNAWIAKYGAECKTLEYTPKKSFNAGVLVLDLDKLRRNAMCAYCMKLYEPYGINDQMLLNFYCDGHYMELPSQFNIFVGQDDVHFQGVVPGSPSTAVMYHFAGSQKPWLFPSATDYPHRACLYELWHRFEKKGTLPTHIPG